MRMIVLGHGHQGSACAYALLHHSAIDELRLADKGTTALPAFLSRYADNPRLVRVALDAKDPKAVARAMAGVSAVMCALPYYYNFEMTRLAIDAGVHFCDLGGNTEIEFHKKGLDRAARQERA